MDIWHHLRIWDIIQGKQNGNQNAEMTKAVSSCRLAAKRAA